MTKHTRSGWWRAAAVRALVGGAVLAGGVSMLLTEREALAQPGGRGGPGGGFGGGMGGGMGGMRDAFMGPALTIRQLERYADLAGLTDDQLVAAEAIVEAYQERVRQQGETMRRQADRIRAEWEETRNPNVWQGMRGVTEQIRAERKALDDGLMSEIKSILEPAQEEKWPAFERAVRRDQGVRRGFLSGERVNLFDLLERADLPSDVRTNVNTVLADYDVELDRVLTARNTMQEEIFTKMMELRQGGNFEEMQKMVERGREASARVRDVNRRFARQLMDVLPEGQRAIFDIEFKRASFPEVYRPTLAQRSLDAAVNFNDLTEEQREGVQRLRDSYLRSLETSNARLASEIEKQEMAFNIGAMMQRGMGGGRDDNNPANELRRERRESISNTMDNLRRILTPAQVERLPAREQDGGDDRGRQRQQPRRGGEDRT